MNRPNITKQMLEYQKQVLDFQKAAFENGYNALVALQDRQLELADRMMNQLPNLPDEAHELVRTWRSAAEDGQRQFKQTVDSSFDAITEYLDRFGTGEATGTDGAENAAEETPSAPKTPENAE